MINLKFALENPWANEDFKNLFCKEAKFSKNKDYSFEIVRYSRELLTVGISLTHRSDHAGLTIELGLFGYNVSAGWYDTRHWNYKKQCWGSYD